MIDITLHPEKVAEVAAAAREHIEELEADARWKAEREKEKQESREKRKKFFSGFLGKDDGDDKPTKNRPPEF